MPQLLIKNVTLIDGTGAAPVDDAAIIIEDGVIAHAGRDGVAPVGADEIDGAGLWAVPGLIDMHVHLDLVGSESLPLFLALGQTAIRDTGGAFDTLIAARKAVSDGAPGPRLLFTGPMIDGDPPTWPAMHRLTADAEDAARAVDEHLAAGADAIKLYSTLPVESLRRAIEQVDGRVPVTGHLGRTLASEAMAAGINGLEHALLTPYNDFAPDEMRTAPGETMMSPTFWPKVAYGWTKADLASDRAKRWIDLLAEKDVSFCPTLTVLPGAGDEPSEEELRFAPQVVAERWRESEQQREGLHVPAEARERARAARVKLQELVALVHEGGGRIVSGTDTGAIRHLIPGFALHRELAYLSEAGLSNMDVLRAATACAAEALWRDDLGTIEAGKRADLLLLRRNPLDDIGALRDIERVVVDGKVLDPKELVRAPAQS